MKKLILFLILASTAGMITACCPVPKQSLEKMSYEKQLKFFPEVSYQELVQLINNKAATVIDANSPKTFDSGHIPSAKNFFKAQVQNQFMSILPEDKAALVISYCGGPQCSAWLKAAKAAHELGYENVKHYAGGLKGWKEAGGQLVR